MTSMFWGLRLEPGKRYSTTVDKSFHVSMAALDVMKSDKDIQTVMLEEGESNIPFILCNLQKPKVLQCPLDLTFVSGDRVTFFCRGGNGTVHLTGYLMPTDEDDDDDDFSKFCEEVEVEEEEDEEEEECEGEDALKKGKVNGLPSKRKAESQMDGPSKKKSPQISAEQDSDDSDEDEDDSQDEDEGEEESEDEGEEELEDESEEESEVGEEESKEPTSSQGKTKKNKVEKSDVNREEKKKELPKKEGVVKKDSTKKLEGGVVVKDSTKKLEGGVVVKDSTKKLEGGVVVKDIIAGTGPLCKPGRMATVYYTGRLKSNNKVFDSSLQGAGFKFRVGRGEVIKGWDIGVSGMKVGGKRLITCPPSVAYGAKGSPPTIPPNSTLLFEVELKAVN